MSLNGKIALVTGATGGLGRSICVSLAKAGAQVAVHHVGEEARGAILALELGRGARAFEKDLRSWTNAAGLIREVEATIGSVDILVNNAGVMDEVSVAETTEEIWRRTLDVDLGAVMALCQAVIPSMQTRGQGSIVNVASQLAYVGAPNVVAYAAAKAGVVGLTRALAREVGPAVRVNAIAPGPTETSMIVPFADPTWREARTRHLIRKSVADPQDVAPAVLFLVSSAGELFHGQVLHPNGGGYLG